MSDARELAVFVLGLVVVAIVLNPFLATLLDVSDGERGERIAAADRAESIELTGKNVTDLQVNRSLGTALQLSESGSAEAPLAFDSDDDWAVSTWVRLTDTNTTGQQTIVSLAGRVTLVHNGTTDEWAGWVYDDTTSDLHRVAVNTSTPGQWTLLTFERSGTDLTLTRNVTTQSSSTLADAETTQTLNTSSLHGSLEETRTFNASLSSAQRTQLYDDPTAPTPARTQRVMYDRYDPIGSTVSSFPLFGAAGTVSVSGGTLVDGFAESVTIDESDYSVADGFVVRDAGGDLENSPMYARWTSTNIGALRGVLDGLNSAVPAGIGLLTIGIIVLAARTLLDGF